MTRRTRTTLASLTQTAPTDAQTFVAYASMLKRTAKTTPDRATRRKLQLAASRVMWASQSILALADSTASTLPTATTTPTARKTNATVQTPTPAPTIVVEDGVERPLTRKERRKLNKAAWRKASAEREKLRKAGKLARAEGETLSRAERKAQRKAERAQAKADRANTITCDHCGSVYDLTLLDTEDANALIRGESCAEDGCTPTNAYRQSLCDDLTAEMDDETADETADEMATA